MKAPQTVLFLGLTVSLACNRSPEPGNDQPAPPQKASPQQDNGPTPTAFLAPPTTAAPKEAEVSLTWTDPPGWTRVKSPSSMRLATYKVPRTEGDSDDAELSVFHFGDGGGVDANFERWIGQFQDIDRTKVRRQDRTNGNLKEHLLEIDSGKFAGGMGPMSAPQGGGPKPNYGMLGAVIEAPSGAYFFKLTGPSKTVKAARPAFLSFLDGMKHP